MPDEALPENDSMSVQDAIRLKHSLGQSTTWGTSNLNALQVEDLTKLTAEDYARVRKDYRKWNVNVVSTVMLVLITFGSVGGCIYLPFWWLKVIAMSVGISCFYMLAKRDGHAEGYIDGYDAGHEAGIHKTLGIKPEEFAEMHEFATDMKIDDMLVRRMDEREAKGK